MHWLPWARAPDVPRARTSATVAITRIMFPPLAAASLRPAARAKISRLHAKSSILRLAARDALIVQYPAIGIAATRIVGVDAALLALPEHGLAITPASGLRVEQRRHDRDDESQHEDAGRHDECDAAAATRTWTRRSSHPGSTRTESKSGFSSRSPGVAKPWRAASPSRPSAACGSPRVARRQARL